jgi:hypothetical protein
MNEEQRQRILASGAGVIDDKYVQDTAQTECCDGQQEQPEGSHDQTRTTAHTTMARNVGNQR